MKSNRLFTILQAINLSTIRNEMDYIRSLFYAHSMQNRFLLNLEFLVTQIKLISDDEPILVFECNSIPEVGDFSSFFLLNPIRYGLFEVLSHMGGGPCGPPLDISAVGP